MENKNLDKRLADLEKNFGLTRGSSDKLYETVRIGIYSLDFVVDEFKIISGGHKLEFYGNESSGKTTFALKTVAKYQSLGKICVWVVSESFDEKWAKQMGVDVNKLLRFFPDSVEDAGEKILELIPEVDLIVLDSIASLVPESELKGTLSDKTRGASAKAYSEFTRKLYKKIAHETTTLIFINQIREKMNVMYGNPEVTTGGRALKFMYDTRIEFKIGKPIDVGQGKDKVRIGTELKLHGYKNKRGVAKRTAYVNFYFEEGKIQNNISLLYAGIKYSVIEFSGKSYQFGDKKAVGKAKFLELMTNKDWDKVEKEVWKRLEKK